MIQHEVPKYPFQKIGTDICDFGGQTYLIIVDYLSKWIEILDMKTKTAEEVIEKMRAVFSNFGIPEEIISDNMPYNSIKYRQFSKEYNFKITTSSPLYPKSNGMSERAVQTAKTILRKSKESGVHYLYSLLEYRNAPIPDLNMSPAELLLGKKTRSKIPVMSHLLKQKNSDVAREKLLIRQNKSKQYYNQRTRQRPILEPKDNVTMQKGRNWEPAVIIQKAHEPRSYIVKDENGRTYRRNASHLRKSKLPYVNKSQLNEDLLPYSDSDVSNSFEQLDNNSDDESSINDRISNEVNIGNTVHTRSGRVISKPVRYRN